MKIYPVKISYDELVLEADEMIAEDGRLTVITGESGSGKSSLLSYIYLCLKDKPSKIISFGKEYDVEKDGHFIKSELVTYIRQDRDFIEDISCYENVRLLCSVTDKTLNKEDILSIFKEVGLDIDVKLYPNQLSGGERCKLAFAIALARKSEIILFDEITASLDEKSVNEIIGLLYKLCNEHHKTIVCTTHSKELEKYANTLYTIEDKKLVLIKRDELDQDVNQNKSENSGERKSHWKIVWQRLSKDYVINIVYTIFISVLVGMICIGFQYAFQYRNSTKVYKQYSNTQDYYISNSSYGNKRSTHLYDDRFLPFSEDQKQLISKTLGDLTYVPYYNFYLYETFISEKDEGFYSFELYVDDKKIEENNQYNIKVSNQPTYIYPYYPEQEYDKLCTALDKSEDGVYLSSDFARIYGLTSVDNTKIKMRIAVPAYYTKEVTTILGGRDYDIRANKVKFVDVEVPVRGILSNFSLQIFGTNNIYMNHEMMEDILNENKLTGDQLPENGYEIDVSTYLVFTEDDTDLSRISKTFNEEDTQLIFQNLTHYYDNEGMKNIENEEVVAKFIYIAFFSFIILLLVYGKIHEKKENKFYETLSFYGFSRKIMIRYILMNIVIFSVLIIILSGCLSVTVAIQLKKEVILLHTFTYYDILKNVAGMTVLANTVMSIPILVKVMKKHD